MNPDPLRPPETDDYPAAPRARSGRLAALCLLAAVGIAALALVSRA